MAAAPASNAELARVQQDSRVCPPPNVDSAHQRETFAELTKIPAFLMHSSKDRLAD